MKTLKGILISFLASIFLIVSLYYYSEPIWARPDDSTMGMVTQGLVYVNQPDYHIPFTHFYIARVLTVLGSMFPNLFWYGILVVGITLVSFALSFGLVLKIATSPFEFFIGSLLLGVVYIEPLIFVTFTKGSILLAFSSLLLAGTVFQQKTPKVANLIVPLVFFLFASLLRYQGAILSLGFFIVFIVLIKFFHSEYASIKKLMIFCLILLVSSTLLHSIHVHEFTKQSSWKNFFPAYDVLTYFLDYQRDINEPNLKAKLNELGISDPEINLIKNWMLSQEIISDIQIRAIKNLIPSSNISLLKGSLIMFQDYIYSRITLFLVFSSLALFCGLKKVKLGLGVLSVFFIISTYLITFKKLPERVYLPFLSLIPLSSFFFNWENLLSSVRKPFVAIFIFTLLWMNVSQLRFIKKTTHQHLLINEQLILDINDLERSPQITYLWRNDSWFEHLPVLKFPSKEMKDLNLIGFGWLSRSAYSINRSMKLGAINPILGSVDNDKMLWVSDTDTNKALKDFIKHKYNLLVHFDLVQQGKILQVWKVRRL